MNATLQACVGYGFSEATGDHRLNADEEQFARRVSRSPFWRDCIARAAADALLPEIEGPMTFTILEPCPGAGETFGSIAQVHARTGMAHPFYTRSETRLRNLFCPHCGEPTDLCHCRR